MRSLPCLLLASAVFLAPLRAQEPAFDEYQVKAVYLFNFLKFVEWPPEASAGPLVICVAGRNPFGDVLQRTVQGEFVSGRPIETRIILEPEPGCHIVFVPLGATTTAYVRAARGQPVLTVGEQEGFLALGGIISFYLEGPNVRFAINPDEAARANLRISSRLLQLAKIPDAVKGLR